MNDAPKLVTDVAPTIFTVDICLRYKDEVLLLKRSPTRKAFPGWLTLPGGHIEEGENPLTAALREIKEESNVTLTPESVQLKFVAMHQHVDRNELYVVFGFLSILTEKPEHVVSNGEGELVWMKDAELATSKTLFPPVSYYLPHLMGNKPGVIYNYSIWKDSNLVRVVSQEIDSNS